MSESNVMTKSIAPYYQSPILTIPGVMHGFWRRQGGVSPYPFNTLNISRHKGDSDANVLANRARIMENMKNSTLCLVKQVHSTKVVWVDQPVHGDIEADGLITRTPGLALGVMTADCIPLLMIHPPSKTIAAVHAGWRGTVAGIAQETLRMMGVPPHEVLAAIGPCIWQISYEVGHDVYNGANAPDFFLPSHQKKDHFLYDLPGHLMHILAKAGVEKIAPSPANTYELPDHYFSFRRKTHRKEPQAGNQLSLIALQL